MLMKIKRLFLALSEQPEGVMKPDLKTSVAALMTEVMRADNQLDEEEERALAELLATHFSLTDDEVAELVGRAGAHLDESIDYFQYSRNINAHTSAEQRIEIIELLWRIACADGRVDKHEEHVIRRISDLLYVTHKDFIAAKLAAQQA